MARKARQDNGSWAFAEELFERADPTFVREVRRLTDAERLGAFAARWFADPRPAARQFLLDYLDQPPNAFRHEALVKRLFKLAEQAADDEVMGRFLVLLDRSVRRVVRSRSRQEIVPVPNKEQAVALAERARAEGVEVSFEGRGKRADDAGRLKRVEHVVFDWTEDALVVPQGTALWRPYTPQRVQDVPFGAPLNRLRRTIPATAYPLTDDQRAQWEGKRLFSVATRHYLRRRAWRYFRNLGKRHPERYVTAAAAALKQYRDEDVADGAALLDCWGLMHLLFHHTPVARAWPRGWGVLTGKSLRELAAAPAYEELWREKPRALLGLLREGRCRPVRHWGLQMIRRGLDAVLRELSAEELLDWLAHPDPTVVTVAADLLRESPDLSALGVGRLLRLLEAPNPETVEIVCGLLEDCLAPDRVTLGQATQLAVSRPLPVARLGFVWLQVLTVAGVADVQPLLGLVEAEAEPLRPELMRWLRRFLSSRADFQAEQVLEYLDSRHADVRAEGWRWLQEEPRASEDVGVWQRLLESPYDDVRLGLVDALEGRLASAPPLDVEKDRLDAERVRLLWATVLVNVRRGGRKKPVVVGQLARRLVRRPEEAGVLLPVLAVALRSVRGPEWRAGLTAVVRAVESNPALRPVVGRAFPELKFGSGGVG